MLLNQCKPGQCGTIIDVDYHGPVGQRLLEMGLLAGTMIRVIRVATLGCPVQYEVNGYRLSLRKNEASRVRIAS